MTINNMDFSLGELVPSTLNRVVAVEPNDNGVADIYIRDKDQITCEKINFRPFILITDSSLLNPFEGEFVVDPLNGFEYFKFIVKLKNLKVYTSALKYLRYSTGYSPSATNSPYRVFSDLQQQVLIQNNFRLFRELKFSETYRMQVDIETLTSEGYDFPNSKREDDKIIIISMSDNRGWEQYLLVDETTSEKEILEQFVTIITEKDPDIIEGHNLYRFDLPFITERAKRHKVRLKLGRNGSTPKTRTSRFSVAERTISYTRYEIYGRHIVDTYFLAQLYDVIHRDLESYGLKSIAKHFGVASKERTYIDASNIKKYYIEERDNLLKYALDDVRETRAISEILSPSYYYQAQIQPFSYQNIVVRGNASKIDSMLVASYLTALESIPIPEPGRAFTGALTEAFDSGIFQNIWHCDIRSLYPSIIISENWAPSRDHLDKFSFFLKKLRIFRLKAKDREKQSQNSEEKDFYNSLQTTFKVMINSFYGYLGFGFGTFNDFDMAENVTTRGREILTTMLNFLIEQKAKVIEMDTDGIYFQPPSNITSPQSMEKMIQETLPKGIDVELDSTYKSMFCYKSKNYALLNDNNEISITGAALKSRGVEPFIRDYLKDFLSFLLNEQFDKIITLTDDYRTSIQNRSIPLAKLAKSETLKDSPLKYKEKMSTGKGRRSAAYELALNANRTYSAGDQVSYYVTGTKKKLSVVDNSYLFSEAPDIRDENSIYYIGKLDDIYKKFSVFVPKDNGNQGEFSLS